MQNIFVVAIDGHAGCGKSSICSETCKKMGWIYINTGALYRGLGYLAYKNKVNLKNSEELTKLLNDFSLHYSWNEQSQSLFYNNIDLSSFLFSEEVGFYASTLATYSQVRENFLSLQRKLIASFEDKTVLVEGRDIGTVVCPEAPVKIFMTASIEERALRRLKQLEQSNQNPKRTLSQLKEDIIKRDKNDSNRKIAPLLQAQDALVFDTSQLSFEECINKLSSLISKHKKA